MKTRSRLAGLGALAGLAATLAVVVPAAPAAAHGGLTFPATRTYACYVNGIEGGNGGNIVPTNPACQNALAENGNYPFYNWFGNLISDAGGRHREIIPDGELCGPTANFSAFNAPGEDWPTTTLRPRSQITFQYNAWAPHPGTWYQYVTKDGWDPDSPLGWDDLESAPFDQVTDPPLRSGGPEGAEYHWDATLPDKSGRHVIYSIWQRSDSPEAFYNCSDVVFDDDGGTNPDPGDTTAPTAPGTPEAGTLNGTSARISWPAADDDVGVTGYTVHDTDTGETLATTPNTSATLSGLTPDTEYGVHVVARDAAGNTSPPSPTLTFNSGGAPQTSCEVDYATPDPWHGGFTAQVSVYNGGHEAVNGWELEWDFTNGETATQSWNSTLVQSGTTVTVSNASWNAVIPHHGSVEFGFNADAPSGPGTPEGFTLNGSPCSVA
ncbi:lytic polysaccharide monooxygenase [Actinorugispora endophytica]|uniref:Chitin-binding protein n=1 Tax=Actinorugispora endophytica TaxID=1605990 RepID=A0A4R6UH23_9ACTN|nr:lytic polysaccharide monooxygenase [Actinorugispora endophytica]TDQ46118.1 chitin-binding protein [Actinorugispora endophytica]